MSDALRQSKIYPTSAPLRERDERVEALKAVVGKIAHDFNNFLVPLLGYVALIQEEMTPGTSGANYASTLETATRKTERYLENILVAMRPYRRFAPKEFNLAELVRTTTQAWQRTLPADSQISVTISAPDHAEFCGDSQQWKMAFEHLLSNARHALATGGSLEIKLETTEVSEAVAAELNIAPGSAFKLTVADSGFGMSQETLNHCVEPFFTTRGGQTPGLGLTVVHSVVQLHGGQVVIESAEDHGTTVTLWVPANKVAPAVQARSPLAQRTPGLGKILLVEDDPLVRDVMKNCLLRTKRDVLVGTDGVEGLKLFKRHAADVRLIVTDVTMPNMNGVELYEAIRQTDPNVKIVFVSGDAETPLQELMNKGMTAAMIVKKPFTLKAFTEIVQTYLK